MKTFVSEFGHSYETYSFAYALYAQMEKNDTLSGILHAGYLPFSGAKGVHGVFYMARSVRSDVRKWKPTSENRRVLAKFDGHFERKSYSVKDIRNDKKFFDLCLHYFNLAHGSVMPRERLELILDSGLIKEVVTHEKDGVPQAYILLTGDEKVSHYWFSFYKEEYIKTSMGMWLALDYIRAMQGSKQHYFYFGTCYAEKALYKTNVEPLEYWNGNEWVHDTKALKALCRSDEKRKIPNHADIYKADFKHFT